MSHYYKGNNNFQNNYLFGNILLLLRKILIVNQNIMCIYKNAEILRGYMSKYAEILRGFRSILHSSD